MLSFRLTCTVAVKFSVVGKNGSGSYSETVIELLTIVPVSSCQSESGQSLDLINTLDGIKEPFGGITIQLFPANVSPLARIDISRTDFTAPCPFQGY